VPLDDGFHGIHDEKRTHRIVFQRSDRCIAEAPIRPRQHRRGRETGQAEVGESDLDFMEEARHEKSLSQLNLEDLQVVEHGQAATA